MTTDREKLNKMEQDLLVVAARYSVTRFKVSTLNFDRDYRLGEDGKIRLISEKAVIRTLGQVTKVPIGPDEQFKTFEEAFEATKKRWSEYYKVVRTKRTEASKLVAAKKQRRYRASKSREREEFRERTK